ncbi:ATP-binding cassette domain-containing protein [candidate division WOR-3 bacterium]|uniref:ATP-binding cassette domain-containing protein n=1 Tax=candidate division WOR-3 bacterium TaxID=2052148 RepID=A0A7C5DDN2_UNCW3|nr:ATP-binding cassette domain-containing protein [candidate division WOR-3 bacterium]HHE05100.1 ATP-binding cassette domain-containing protein [candidate division WOR-3 bacterium]
MNGIHIANLYKYYRSEKRKEGLKGAIRSLYKREYKEIKAIDGITLDISKGEMVGLIGPNGAGKTTLMKLLSGVLYAEKGRIEIDGFVPFRRKKEFLKNITLFTGQRSFLSIAIWDLPPEDGYELLRHIYGIERGTFKERLSFFVELLKAEELVHKPLRKLSLGERTKVELIASMIHFPTYVFLDEPTIGLDVLSQKTLWDFFKTYNRETGATLIISSHYIRDLEELGKRVLILNKGKVIYDGEKERLKSWIGDKKYVKIELAKPDIPIPFKGAVREDSTVCLEIEKKNIQNFIDKITGMDGIIDIEVTDPPLEKIIRDIFEKEG